MNENEESSPLSRASALRARAWKNPVSYVHSLLPSIPLFGKSFLGTSKVSKPVCVEGGSSQAVVASASSGVALGSAAGGNARAGVPGVAAVAVLPRVNVNKRSHDEDGGIEQDCRGDYRPSKRPRLLSVDNGEMFVSSFGNSALVKQRGSSPAAARGAAEQVSPHPRADTPALVVEGVNHPPEQQRLLSWVNGETWLCFSSDAHDDDTLPVSALLRQERFDTILKVEQQRLGFLEWILRTTLVSYEHSFLPVWKSCLLGQAGLDTILQEMKQQCLEFLESILGATLVSFIHCFLPVVEELPGHEQLGTILKVEHQRFVSVKSTLEETLYERSLLPVKSFSSRGTSMAVPMIGNEFSND